MDAYQMGCEGARALLARYGDGELDEKLGAPLRKHLMDCGACRALVADQRNLSRWLQPAEAPPVPAGFAARVARAAFAGPRKLAPLSMESDFESSDLEANPSTGFTESNGTLRLVLALTSAAAVALFGLSLALGLTARPAARELAAEPLNEVLRQLDELNAADSEVADDGEIESRERADSSRSDTEPRR